MGAAVLSPVHLLLASNYTATVREEVAMVRLTLGEKREEVAMVRLTLGEKKEEVTMVR